MGTRTLWGNGSLLKHDIASEDSKQGLRWMNIVERVTPDSKSNVDEQSSAERLKGAYRARRLKSIERGLIGKRDTVVKARRPPDQLKAVVPLLKIISLPGSM